MPFTTNGTFERLHSWEEDRLNGIEIVTDHHDAEDDNFADGLSQTVLKDGRTPMEGNLNLGGFRITNCATGQNPNDVVTKKQLDAINLDFVPISGDCEILDSKKFLSPPLIEGLKASDNSLKSATTAFVHTAIEEAFASQKEGILDSCFPNYQSVQSINSGFKATTSGFVIFDLPVRMVGWIQIGTYQKSFSYNYNNTQPAVIVFPVQKGISITFSGCSAQFTSI